MVHRVRTGHSVSVGKYAPRDNRHHFGTGQGSRGSPSFWRAILEVILNAVDAEGEGMVFQNPQGTVESKRTTDGFVDDCGLGVDGRDDNIVGRLQHLNQIHEELLHVSGGKLSLEKSHWVYIHWEWKNGYPVLADVGEKSEERLEGECYEEYEDGKVLRLCQSEDNKVVAIRRLSAHTPYRTLG